MARLKTVHRCQECGYTAAKPMGQCPGCENWNTFIEEVVETKAAALAAAATGPTRALTDFSSEVVTLEKVSLAPETRTATKIPELDRLLGGGVVPGQMILLAGAPGIGKSTLMLQAAAKLADGRKVLYASGEESLKQISARAQRLRLSAGSLYLVSETNLAKVVETVAKHQPAVLILDSIQTCFHPELQSSPGSVAQVRECAAELLRVAKKQETVVFVLGHVTKDGTLAGPKVLEHIVDTVLYFDTERHDLLRVLRAQKNRFGPTDEVGLFEMSETGLREVRDAAQFFMADRDSRAQSGRAVSVTLEGSRPMLVEVQSLVVHTKYPLPRRMATGLDLNRVLVLIAAMEKHLHLRLEDRDAYVSLAGGVRLKDPALDLAACMALASSWRDRPLPADMIMIGEVGLLGEVSRVPYLENRLKEAAKAGFSRALVPAKAAKDLPKTLGLRVSGVADLREAAALLFAGDDEPDSDA
jgi:DNA repair protein RadA/Sms